MPAGTVSLLDAERMLGTATLQDGAAVISLQQKALERGRYNRTVTYSGDEQVEAGGRRR